MQPFIKLSHVLGTDLS